MADESTGDALRRIRDRAGVALDALAKAAGYRGASSIQRYFSSDFESALPGAVARRLADGFAKLGRDGSEIMRLVDEPASNAKVVRYEGAADIVLHRDVPVYGTALGAPKEYDGTTVEQTELDTFNVIDYFVRPTVLQGRADVYGVYIQGSSMYPRFGEGETAFVDPKRPPRIGDDVLVQLVFEDGAGGERPTVVLIKRLVRRTSGYVELEQFNPAKSFKVPAERVKSVHRVIPWSELLS